jgi:uncharacterized protein with PQ loop repeat
MSIITNICSILSVICYSLVYYPQFYEIYKTKCTKGISIWMLLLWSQADFMCLYSTILLGLLLNLIIMAWYHVFIGFCITIFTFYYKIKNDTFYEKVKMTIIITIYYTINIIIGLILTFKTPQTIPSSVGIGLIFSWVSVVFYIVGRLPQIILNFKRRSTDGLSVVMYIFKIMGNVFYILTIITYSVEKEYLLLNLAWIVFTVVTILMDLFVISQYIYYNPDVLISSSMV